MMQEKITTYIVKDLSNETLDGGIEITEDLLGSGILDSLGMMKLISFIEEEFDCTVLPEEMIIENFMTVRHIVTYIKSKQ